MALCAVFFWVRPVGVVDGAPEGEVGVVVIPVTGGLSR